MSYQLTLPCVSKFIDVNLCDSHNIFSWFFISSPKLSSWSYYTIGHRRCPTQIIKHFCAFTGSCYPVLHTLMYIVGHSLHTDLSQEILTCILATNTSSQAIFFLSFTASILLTRRIGLLTILAYLISFPVFSPFRIPEEAARKRVMRFRFELHTEVLERSN